MKNDQELDKNEKASSHDQDRSRIKAEKVKSSSNKVKVFIFQAKDLNCQDSKDKGPILDISCFKGPKVLKLES